jgi:UDP-N-acetylmuramoyl-tripeptide--D-alanyl-D-alanine ligase
MAFAPVPVMKGIQLVAAIAIFPILIGLIIAHIPRKAKKKFVVTDRVKRLFITYAVLALIMVLVPYIVVRILSGDEAYSEINSMLFALFGMVIYCGPLPFVTALANLINKPIENRINKWFIDDAKRILSEHEGLRIIGITGSYGKTSVKYYLTTLLSEGFRVLMTPESYNTPMGIVRTIREHMQPTHEIFVCEMGARHLHDIKEITDIVHPDDGIVTSIGPQHLETFHSMDNIISTKYELLDAVDEKEASPSLS